MDELTLARAIHVLGVVLWIGGVAFATSVVLPAAKRRAAATGDPAAGLELFHLVEKSFVGQARITVVLTGASGLYMVHLLDGWARLHDPSQWWLIAMFVIWVLFMLALFVIEPFILPRVMHKSGPPDPTKALRIMTRAHVVLSLLSLLTIIGAIIGVHGG